MVDSNTVYQQLCFHGQCCRNCKRGIFPGVEDFEGFKFCGLRHDDYALPPHGSSVVGT
jgi:hypothetical protein